MTINFELTAEDYYEFNYYYQWSSPEKKWYRIIYRLITFSVLFFIPFFMGYKLSNYGFYEYSLGLMGLAYALFFFGSFTKWLIKRQADKVLNGGKNINLIGHRTINFNDSKVYFKTDTENSEIEWKAFEKLCETEQYLFLFASVNQALIVPKKHLSDIEVKELKELIRQKL